jgi:hypothetical protein
LSFEKEVGAENSGGDIEVVCWEGEDERERVVMLGRVKAAREGESR